MFHGLQNSMHFHVNYECMGHYLSIITVVIFVLREKWGNILTGNVTYGNRFNINRSSELPLRKRITFILNSFTFIFKYLHMVLASRQASVMKHVKESRSYKFSISRTSSVHFKKVSIF